MVHYETVYSVKKRGEAKPRAARYRTKSLTPMHAHLREAFAPATTLKYDTSVEWPFGAFSEVIAQSKAAK